MGHQSCNVSAAPTCCSHLLVALLNCYFILAYGLLMFTWLATTSRKGEQIQNIHAFIYVPGGKPENHCCPSYIGKCYNLSFVLPAEAWCIFQSLFMRFPVVWINPAGFLSKSFSRSICKSIPVIWEEIERMAWASARHIIYISFMI